MTARLVDDRTLHLAAQLDLSSVVAKLLERSASNAANAEEEEKAKKAAEKIEKKKRRYSQDSY